MKESFTYVLLFLNNGIRNSSENYGLLTLAISGVETKTSKFLIPVNVEINKSKLSKFVANSDRLQINLSIKRLKEKFSKIVC